MTDPQAQPTTMTDPDSLPPGALLDELAGEDDGAHPPPFLQIMASYPAAAGTPDHITIEMNLDDAATLGEDGQSGEDGAIKSWFTDFCTQVIGAMRRNTQTPILVTVAGAGVKKLLGDRTVHAEGCDGSCGLDDDPAEGAAPGEPIAEAPVEDPRAANGEPAPADDQAATAGKDGQ